ncbi:MAG TPA: ATP phosphoribosyltransferase regulatory subunit [Vicinamibacteria bacterium]|nr:ATP phosphoribosyltransferase regulatory subunit [Vicinamibacteria bacterium]
MSGFIHTRIQVPPGVQCFVGAEARCRRRIEERVLAVFEGWSYEEIIPPLFDYADVFPEELASRTYAFVGRDGALLALRPDFTSLLAKLAAGRLLDREAPIRLYYSGEVLRYEPPKAGRQSELYQMGCELMGARGVEADAEVLAIAAEALAAAGVRDVVLSLGHVGVFSALAADAGLTPEQVSALRERIESKDEAGVRDVLAARPVAPGLREALLGLASLSGDVAGLERAAAGLGCSPRAAAALEELVAVVAALRLAGLGDRLALDLGEVRGLGYYTGLVFRAYAPGLGFEVASGGRYDELLARFGRPLPAVGFMLGLDRLAVLLERQGGRDGALAPASEAIAGASAGERLRSALERRRVGARVRFADARGPR